MATRTTFPTPQRVVKGRFWQIGLMTVLGAAVANLIVRAILLAIFPISPGFLPFTFPPIVIFTTMGVAAGMGVFALVGRWSKQPRRTYTWVALVALVLSCIPNVLLALNPAAAPSNPAAPVQGTSLDWALLIVLHVVPALVAIGALTRFGVEDTTTRMG